MIYIKKLKEIELFLEGKIKIEKDEEYNNLVLRESSNLKEVTIQLEDGFLTYIISQDKTKCYIALTEHKNSDMCVNLDEYEDYFNVETLNDLLNLLQ